MKNLKDRHKQLHWTFHARAKMCHWRLSEQRVKRVLHSPKRIEEGIAPKTVAMMQPASIRRDGRKEAWKQEIWVMVQDIGVKRKVISAWRYPAMSKPRDEITQDFLKNEYAAFMETDKELQEEG